MACKEAKRLQNVTGKSPKCYNCKDGLDVLDKTEPLPDGEAYMVPQ